MVLLQQKRCSERAKESGALNMYYIKFIYRKVTKTKNKQNRKISKSTHNLTTEKLLEYLNTIPSETSFYDPASDLLFDYVKECYYKPVTYKYIGDVSEYGYPPKSSFIRAGIEYNPHINKKSDEIKKLSPLPNISTFVNSNQDKN